MNKYRELAKLFNQTAKTLEALAEIEDIKVMFGVVPDPVGREEELLAEFNDQMDRIRECKLGGKNEKPDGNQRET